MGRDSSSDTSAGAVDLVEMLGLAFVPALSGASVGTWAVDYATGAMAASHRFLDMHGLAIADFVGTLDEFLAAADPEDRPGMSAAFTATATTGCPLHVRYRMGSAEGRGGHLARLDGSRVVAGTGGAERTVLAGIALVEIGGTEVHGRSLAEAFLVRDGIARALESSLLPPGLAEPPGFVVDADYRSIEGPSTGDFYDLFPLAGTDWGMVIGDVGGHGTAAAAVTTAIRYSLRAGAILRGDVTTVMAAANEAHFAAAEGERFTTAHYVRIGRRRDTVELRVGTAGHPPLIIRRADGSTESLAGSGPMLGLMRSASYTAGATQLQVGDRCIAYTDGVIESRRGEVAFGDEDLQRMISSWEGPIEGMASALHDAAIAFSESGPQDDMATVILERVS